MATASVVRFSDATYYLGRDDTSPSIRVTRTGETAGEASVPWAVKSGTAGDDSERTLDAGTLRFAAGETQQTFRVSIPRGAARDPTPLRLDLSEAPNVKLGEPHRAVLAVEAAGWFRGPAWRNAWRVIRHVALAAALLASIYGLSRVVLATAEGWSRNWRAHLVPTPEPVLTFPEGTPTTAAEQARLQDQLARTRQRSRLHLDVMTFYYTRYYMAIILLLLVASLAAITLVLIGKRGWEATNQYIITTFFVMTAASVFFGAWPRVFRQEQNITDNKVFFLKYLALENEIFSYAVTNEALNYLVTTDELKKPGPARPPTPQAAAAGGADAPLQPAPSPAPAARAGTPLSAKEFIHYVDIQLAQDNIAIGFDYTQVPDYKNVFDPK